MSDLEKEKFRQIGIDLINEYRVRGKLKPIDWLVIDTPEVSAFIRSIQLHEAIELEFSGFKQLVSDAAEKAIDHIKNGRLGDALLVLDDLTIPTPKPDPLFDVLWDLGMAKDRSGIELMANRINETLDAAGFEIRKKNDG